MRRFNRGAAALGFVLLASACGGGTSDGAGAGGGGGGGGGGGEASVTIESPSDGAEVTLPFELEFSATGGAHVHVYYDGNEDDFEVVDGESFEVTELSPGEHTVAVSVRNKDHSAVGAEDEISVTVTGNGTGGGDEEEDDDGGGY